MAISYKLMGMLVCAAALSACSDGTSITSGNGEAGNNVDTRQLQPLQNDAFYDALRDGLAVQAASSYQYQYSGGTTGDNLATDNGVDGGGTTGGTTTGGASPIGAVDSAESSGADSSTSGSASSERDVTGTNVQVAGVDEQDRIKSDGDFLYVLDTQYAAYDDTRLDTVFIQVDLPAGLGETGGGTTGSSGEDLAAGSTMLAPQTVNTIRILSLQPETPDATAVKDIALDLGGRNAQGMYLYNSGDKKNLYVTSSGFQYYWASWNSPTDFAGKESLVTRLDVTNPEAPAVVDSFQVDGQIISSRRIGNKLFLATRFYPQVTVQYEGQSIEEYKQQLDNATLASALPTYTRVSDGSSQPLVDAANCFVAQQQDSTSYFSADIIALSVVDLDTMALTDSQCFLGASETLYATPNAVYLATTRWAYENVWAVDTDGGAVAIDASYVDPRVDTDIHRFAIDGGNLTYSGSGVVRGHLGWNPERKPFRMSEKDGYLRVATFSEQQNSSVSPIFVSVLQVTNNGELTKIAELPNMERPDHIGKPGEQLYASRFLGNKAYLVTFRQTDPLYVVDLVNPADPLLAGELEIDGYSDYLHPITENYLLGIGKDAVAASSDPGDRNTGAFEQGVKISLFNVADAQNPTEVQSIVIGERGSDAEALRNHRAITIQPANDNHPTRLSFGIDVAGNAEPRPISNPWEWYSWSYTGLHGFEITTGANAGINSKGVMKVESAENSEFGYGPQARGDRSVMVDDTVYYIHGSQVYTANWSNLSNVTGPR